MLLKIFSSENNGRKYQGFQPASTTLYKEGFLVFVWASSQAGHKTITLDLSLLDNQIIIDYVVNQTYILTASNLWQIQVNYLLPSKTRFLYDMTVHYLKMEILSFQSHTNPLRLSSLKVWVRGFILLRRWASHTYSANTLQVFTEGNQKGENPFSHRIFDTMEEVQEELAWSTEVQYSITVDKQSGIQIYLSPILE